MNDGVCPEIEVLPARAGEASIVRAILKDARRWLALRGIAQWTSPLGEGWIAEKIAAGAFFVALGDGVPVAVARLLWEDARFWGERERGDAVYLHTLAVRRELAGRGIGGQMLDWAAGQGHRRGRRWLRLDCAAANGALIAYYWNLGFAPAGEVEIGGETMVLLEREIDSGCPKD